MSPCLGIPQIKWDFREEWIAKGVARGEAKGLEQGFEQGFEQGRVEGEAHAILSVLRTRSLEVSRRLERRIHQIGDLTELDWLLARAVTVAKASELFEEEPS